MELPVLKDKAAPLLWDLMRLFHQTETRWTEHVAEATMLYRKLGFGAIGQITSYFAPATRR